MVFILIASVLRQAIFFSSENGSYLQHESAFRVAFTAALQDSFNQGLVGSDVVR